MHSFRTTISAALLVAALSACGDATGPMDAESKRYDTASEGGTSGIAPASGGGGTYGSGGRAAPDTSGSNTITGSTSTAAECAEEEERGGGTYGSGGRIECATEPKP